MALALGLAWPVVALVALALVFLEGRRLGAEWRAKRDEGRQTTQSLVELRALVGKHVAETGEYRTTVANELARLESIIK